ncbi:MAG: glycosyltransferase family A protein [Candidatus Nitrosocaldaceae archaeon]
MCKWFAIITAKDSAFTIKDALLSIFNQTIKPSYVIVVDDGSIDDTPNILESMKQIYSNLYIIALPNKGYDIRRIVHNWNKALEYSKSLEETDYHFISADDCIYQDNYVQFLIERMNENPKLVIASGTRDSFKIKRFVKRVPEGAGRLIDNTFFKKIGYKYPPYYGYESWILFKALQLGFEVAHFYDVEFKHLRNFGSKHGFVEYGAMMRCLGYNPLFVIARCVRNIIFGTGEIPWKVSLKMMIDYFLADIKFKNDEYYRYYDEEFRRFVNDSQKERLKKILNS